jgi:putative NADPH-quinone reductase
MRPVRVLLVHCHPVPDSFSHALRAAVQAGLARAGHEVDLLDLYAEDFRPVLSEEERRRYHDVGPNLAGIEEHVARLKAAEALVFVYPTWWYGLPAILKGWLDRVWVPGATFTLTNGPIIGELQNIRRIAGVTTYGSPWWFMRFFMSHPGKRLITRGLRVLCARGCRVTWLEIDRMDRRTPPELAAYRDKVEATFARW